jgi:uncharacterized cupin superfamily protein
MHDQRPTVPSEATIVDTPAGRRPASDGWFVINATEARWQAAPGWGAKTDFEPDRPHWFPDFGINIHRLDPGERSTMYHSEETQEDFLVLAGECLAIIEGEERLLAQWDFLHCPPWTRHGFVGAGEGPCTILMVGARRENRSERVEYPPEPAAQRHGAAVREFTTSPDEAYVGTPDYEDAPYRPGTLPGA